VSARTPRSAPIKYDPAGKIEAFAPEMSFDKLMKASM
jgi:hypothetical protein